LSTRERPPPVRWSLRVQASSAKRAGPSAAAQVVAARPRVLGEARLPVRLLEGVADPVLQVAQVGFDGGELFHGRE
jgi:hypothetical protein